MFRLYSGKRALKALDGRPGLLRAPAEKYGVPEALLRAVAYREMTELDLLDIAADAAVALYWRRRALRRALKAAGMVKSDAPLLRGRAFGKKDSSVGWTQIYGFVAIDALNYAVGRGIVRQDELGLDADRHFDKNNDDDLRFIWTRLRRDRAFNMEMCALNLLCAADEMTGKTDFAAMSPDEIKLALTRYNGKLREISPYGEETYGYYLKFIGEPPTAKERERR